MSDNMKLNTSIGPNRSPPTKVTFPMVWSPMVFEPMEFDGSTHVEAETDMREKKGDTSLFQPFSISLADPPTVKTPISKDITRALPTIDYKQVEAKQNPTRTTPYRVARSLIEKSLVVSASKLLYFFDGKSYQPCRKEEAEKKIVENCRDAIAAEGRPSFTRQVYQSLLQEPDICRDWQLYLNIVSFDECLLNLDTFRSFPHTSNLFVTSRLRASYQKGCRTDCPVFKSFLDIASNHDLVLQRRIWQAIGYLLAPDQTGKAFFLLQGLPNSGKTVLGNFIQNCFAGDVVSALDINELGGEFALSDLVGKKLCVDFDLPADPFNKRAVSKLKKLTGGDPTSSNVKFADRVRFVNTAKLLFATNHAALIPNQDEAFFDRMVVIPFTVSIPREAQDRQLPQKLEQERDAIIVQALRAYRDLVADGYKFAGNYLPNEAITGESNPVDAVTQFLVAACEFSEGYWTPTEGLYAAFTDNYGLICGKNEFSTLVFRLSSTLYPGVERKRSRITPTSNPIGGFSNLKLKEEIL